MVFMLVLMTGGITSMSYLLGRVHGYEKSEKDYNYIASKEFWKDVKEHGL